MENLEWTLHPVRDDDGNEMWWLLRGDERLRLGTCLDVVELYEVLFRYIDHGNHDGELDAGDERIIEWITVAQAAELSGESAVTIRWAARNKIEGALPRPWRFSKASFLAWMRDGRNKRTK